MLMRAISVSICPRNSSACSGEMLPARALSSNCWHVAVCRFAVSAVGWPWSVEVQPMVLKNCRRWARALR